MLILNQIIGNSIDLRIAEELHNISHHGVVEYVMLDKEDILRHRLRIKTDKGTECAIQLSRDEHLTNGAVLLLEKTQAIVVKMVKAEWLSIKPKTIAAGLELGYFAGNMHWKVEFNNEILQISLNGPKETYIDRLSHLITNGKIEVIHE